ncbi:related to vacuolar protein sorting protein Vps66 [Cephalotrichum gorgonifer]|uniref:Related to vacuolar protein sorting protein Vps66 n=1 Tax=Cephalotrichum gorgonifer TaxID=2041049 RepID=A0AAE8MSA3_9PEZI|nr:related to vacuolar protein sorting protein Vps66 [Cephalotrichum gorgonifer]
MEKFSQFRDRGSGISPFIPVPTETSLASKLLHATLFFCRLPFLLGYATVYFLFLEYLPLPAAARKLLLWGFMCIPGIWWVDLQMDGVRRGHLAEQPPDRIPHPGSVIAANFTSPIDPLYLAAIFDPVFTISYPRTRQLRQVSLLGAILHALSPVVLAPPPGAHLTDLGALLAKHPGRVIAVFPECSTTNGKGILPPSPSLLTTPAGTHIFPVSIRYSPADVTTPVPKRWIPFLWAFLSQPTICVRVRIAEGTTNTALNGVATGVSSSVDASAAPVQKMSAEERAVLDRVSEALARLGRSRRVGLSLEDKARFVEAWNGKTVKR